ncbi:MAG: helix-turn-helix transcriptional regulator [Anaerotignum sp.]|nr:helix-turn-helix transcriptional regulator [Anaerotignum sp.]
MSVSSRREDKKKKTTSNKLKDLRKKNGETQIEIARLLGLKTSSAYSKKENGSVPISLAEAMILAKHFNQPIEFFIHEF